ncbi:MAG: c-type cytochrome domain-containing protein, partial [Verrucomicrobiota bacterium]
RARFFMIRRLLHRAAKAILHLHHLSQYLVMRYIIGSLVITISALGLQAEDKVNFEKQIWPIIEAKCVSCHKAPYEDNGRVRKPKAGLRFDAAWAMEMGGDNGAIYESGNHEDSEMYFRVTLPQDDDEFMPPVGKADPLTDDELKLMAAWIDQGADYGGWEGNLEGKPVETHSETEMPKSEIQEIYSALSEGLTPIEEVTWKSIADAGGRVMPLAKESPLLAVDFRLSKDKAGDDVVKLLSEIGSNVAHLDLSKTSVSDAALTEIAKLDKLVKLDLHQTQISDAELAQLKGLKNLRYLNLYGTQVSDAGLKHLGEIGSLRAVYLWGSKATPDGAKKLAGSLPPEARVNIK